MRIFTASLAMESNSFSPIPTHRKSFEDTLYFPPGRHPDRPTHCTAPLYVARRQEGFDLVEGSCPVRTLTDFGSNGVEAVFPDVVRLVQVLREIEDRSAA